jgi:type I restriction enzyme S subunit
MADLTSLHKNKPKRDFSIQACADCLNKIALQYPNEFKEGFFTDYFDIAGGTQPPKSTFISEPKDGYIKFLQIRDFSSDTTPTFIPISKNNKICSEKDLVLGRYGASIGKILTGKSGAYNVACAKIIFLEGDSFDREFIFYWLHSSYFQNFLTSISRSAQGGFNKNDLSRIRTNFPSIGLQKKLTSILKSIDIALLNGDKIIFEKNGKTAIEIAFIELVEKFLSFINEGEELSTELTHQLTLVKKLRQQLLQDAVQGKLVEQNSTDEPASELLKKIKAEKQKLISEKKLKKEKELPPIKLEEIPFEIPENWVWCRLGEICTKIGSGSTPKGSNYSTNGKPFFRSQNIYESGLVYDDIKFISDEMHKQMYGTTVYANDILLNITGGSMGRCALVPANFGEGNVSQHVCIIRPLLVDNNFYHSITLSPFFQRFIFSSTTGAGREGLPKYNLEQFIIPLPPIEEQTRIVQKLDELMEYCAELEASIKESEAQNSTLLQQVLREALRKEPLEV